ncbi:MAG: protein-methionine-sulfoxide reductase heme-binding subunit MsrQ [Oleiphilaceae bacterium]|nr:protein-methionine-sulfoxide reductase heme-binding subunit MsrQ [Oleiphilaceae bacterium]
MSWHLVRWWVLFLAMSVPLLVLGERVISNSLGPEPAKALVLYLGEWAIIALFVTLSISPLKRLTGKSYWLRYRRMLGLWCLAYALLHGLAYALLLADWSEVFAEIARRPFLLVGFLALLVLIALGVTSPKSMVRRLGRKWKKLHRLIYLVLLLVLVHVWWQVRSDFGEALLYTMLALLLMAFRLPLFRRSVVRHQ